MFGLKFTRQDIKDTLKKRWWVMLIELAVIGVILLVDLLTKTHIEKTMSLGQSHTLIKGLIDITFTINTGAGFGILQGNTTALTVVTAIVIVIVSIFLLLAQKESEWLRISLVFIVGGGIGNLIDRISPGYVRDFIQFAFWEDFAIFNVADMFVTVGTGMLIVVLIVMLIQEGKKNRKQFEEEQASKEEEPMLDPLDAPINLNPMLKSENDYTFAEPQTDAIQNDTNDIQFVEQQSPVIQNDIQAVEPQTDANASSSDESEQTAFSIEEVSEEVLDEEAEEKSASESDGEIK